MNQAKQFYSKGLGCPIQNDQGAFVTLNLGDGSSALALYTWDALAADAGVAAIGVKDAVGTAVSRRCGSSGHPRRTRPRSPRASAEPGDVLLDVRGVTKKYGRQTVFNGVDLAVRAAQIAAVVGANGCGKSTFLRVCAGLTGADEGEVQVRGSLGYCPQDGGTADFLIPDEHFILIGAGRGMARMDAVRAGRTRATALDWDPSDGKQARHLSGGTRQKLNLVMAGLGDPDVLLLDEPYQGFDRGSYLDFWHQIWQWRDAGKAIVVVTHLLDQLDRVDTVLDLTPARKAVA